MQSVKSVITRNHVLDNYHWKWWCHPIGMWIAPRGVEYTPRVIERAFQIYSGGDRGKMRPLVIFSNSQQLCLKIIILVIEDHYERSHFHGKRRNGFNFGLLWRFCLRLIEGGWTKNWLHSVFIAYNYLIINFVLLYRIPTIIAVVRWNYRRKPEYFSLVWVNPTWIIVVVIIHAEWIDIFYIGFLLYQGCEMTSGFDIGNVTKKWPSCGVVLFHIIQKIGHALLYHFKLTS